MNLSPIKNFVTSKAARQVLLVQKNSPTLLFGAGVVGVVATAVLASKATLRLEDVLEENKKKSDQALLLKDENRPDYTEKDYKQDKAYLLVRSTFAVAKLYAPAIAVGAVSVACLTGSHVILTKRNTGLMAAYATIDKAFKEYRQRVAAEVGEERERDIYRGSEEVEVHDTKAGKVVQTKVAGKNGRSPYARFFDVTNQNWHDTPEYSLFFIKAQQNYLNDRLRAKGHVLLNDAYDALGMSRTEAGCVTGWVYGGEGDNYIDFGIQDEDKFLQLSDFMTGHEKGIWLDFNVDGIVYDLI